LTSREFQSAYRDVHDLLLARSSAGKLARLRLSWTLIREPFEPPEIGGERAQEKGIHSTGRLDSGDP
jgi:hypothetical protein